MSSSQHRGNRKRRRRASKTVVYCAAGGALAALLGGAMLFPGRTSVLLFAAALPLGAVTLVKRRKKRPVYTLIACGCLLLAAAFALRFARVDIGWASYPRGAQTLDLRGFGLKSLKALAQFPSLERVDARDNPDLEVDGAACGDSLRWLDLRGCGLTQEECVALGDRLPGCLILCEQASALCPGERTTCEELTQALSCLAQVEQVDLTRARITAEELAALRERFPGVRFFSQVESADGLHESTERKIALQAASYEEASRLLAQFESPEEVTLTGVSLTVEQALQLKSQLPDAALRCTLSLGTQEVGTQESALAYSGDAQELLRALPLFDSLAALTLNGEWTLEELEAAAALCPDAALEFNWRGARVASGAALDGNGWTDDERTRVQALCPAACIQWTASVLGKAVSSQDTVLDFGTQQVTDEQVRELYEAIGRLPALKEVLLYESELSFESMDRLFDGYPDVFFGFTTHLDNYTVRSDVTAFSTLKNQRKPYYTQDDMYFLRYCRNLQALDLGHNKISDISFLSWFPQLRVLILADNCVTDVSVFYQLPELEYVELFMNQVSDLTPIASLKQLKDLNFCYNLSDDVQALSDVTPLYECTSLERCWLSNNGLSREQQEALRAALPDCEFNFTVEQSTDGGWRKHARYYVVRDMMKSRVYTPFE